MQRYLAHVVAAVTCLLAYAPSALASGAIIVPLDQVQVYRLSRPASTIIVGNPTIADVTMVAPSLLAFTGKSFGASNLVARDDEGHVIVDLQLIVKNELGPEVRLHSGTLRQTFVCSPRCAPMLNIQDAPQFFEVVSKQSGSKLELRGDTIMSEGYQSEKSADRPCDSPGQTAADGSNCGGRSAYIRPGGRVGSP